jgi:hypothetical protein
MADFRLCDKLYESACMNEPSVRVISYDTSWKNFLAGMKYLVKMATMVRLPLLFIQLQTTLTIKTIIGPLPAFVYYACIINLIISI